MITTNIVQSTVLTYDIQTNVLVLEDQSIWSINVLDISLPEDLRPGDKVDIRYEFDDELGVESIRSIVRTDPGYQDDNVNTTPAVEND